MSEMIEVVIDSIRVSLMNQQRIVILREVDADRYIAIWVGVFEAEHLTVALQDIEVSRPLSYDLMKSLVDKLNGRILRVEVVELRDETFFGNIVIEVDGQIMNIDSRPSDAMNLAVRAHVPIMVSQEVMEKAGIIPEEDLAEKAASEDAVVPADDSESEGRLSVFEDFLDQLDIDDMGDEED